MAASFLLLLSLSPSPRSLALFPVSEALSPCSPSVVELGERSWSPGEEFSPWAQEERVETGKVKWAGSLEGLFEPACLDTDVSVGGACTPGGTKTVSLTTACKDARSRESFENSCWRLRTSLRSSICLVNCFLACNNVPVWGKVGRGNIGADG